jgi:hypothetical protein
VKCKISNLEENLNFVDSRKLCIFLTAVPDSHRMPSYLNPAIGTPAFLAALTIILGFLEEQRVRTDR